MLHSDTYVLLCGCGCDNGLIFRVPEDGEEMYISYVHSFHGSQHAPIKASLLQASRLLFTKEKWIGEIITNRATILELIAFLESHPLSRKMMPRGYNSSHLSVQCLVPEEKYDADRDNYSVTLFCDMPKHEILAGKLFRTGEIVYGNRERKILINMLKKAVS